MPKYVIERNVPGVGSLSAAELQAISQKSCGVLCTMGPQIQWVHSDPATAETHPARTSGN